MLDQIGNCRIVGEIGSGGMAVIYKAVQEPLGRTVAIKALKPSIALDSQFAQRFEREALFMASLQHENILHVHDFIKGDGTMYIVMEYVQGIDLYDLLQLTPRLPVDVAAVIMLKSPARSTTRISAGSSTATSSRRTSSSRIKAR